MPDPLTPNRFGGPSGGRPSPSGVGGFLSGLLRRQTAPAALDAPPQPNWLMRALARGGEAQVVQGQALNAASTQALLAAAAKLEEDPELLASWTDPVVNNMSRFLGSIVAGTNPLETNGASALAGPNLSEALAGRGVPPLLAEGSEFLVPDGMGPLDDLLQLGFIPFMRASRRHPELVQMLTARLEQPGGARGFMEDMRAAAPELISKTDQFGTAFGLQTGTGSLAMSYPADWAARGENVIHVDTLKNNGDVGTGLSDLLPVLDLADANRVAMVTEPDPFSHQRLDTRGLEDLYARMGFELAGNGVMIRHPLPADPDARSVEVAARLGRYQRVQGELERVGIGNNSVPIDRRSDALREGRLSEDEMQSGLNLAVLDLDATGRLGTVAPDGASRPLPASVDAPEVMEAAHIMNALTDQFGGDLPPLASLRGMYARYGEGELWQILSEAFDNKLDPVLFEPLVDAVKAIPR